MPPASSDKSDLRSSPVVTRFAPSPSGHLHVGGARTALFNWVYAKGRGGRFVLRIEDTDAKRSSDSASMAFLEDLAWLGIDWDEGPEFVVASPQGTESSSHQYGGGPNGPYFQSQRLEIYNRYIEQLIAEGKAYRAYETAEELEAARAKAKAEGRNYRYDRTAGSRHAAQEDRPHVVRFAVPEGREIVLHDQVIGDVRTPGSPAPGSLDDFVIRKADGYPTYHFAVVVDDELMGVTHVIRAQEHLANTARHILLQEALGFRTPAYAHVSVVMNPDGSKMSKRDKDKALRAAVREKALAAPPHYGDGLAVREEEWGWWIEADDRQLNPDAENALAEALGVQLPEVNVDDFRRAGYLPEVMINYLALLGWNPGENIEKFDREFLLQRFDLNRVIKSPAKFDREKLLAFNLDAIQELSPDEFYARLRQHAERYHPDFIQNLGDESFAHFAQANQARSKTLDDCFRSDRFFVLPDEAIVFEDSKAVRKAMSGGIAHLEAILPILRDLKEWTVESLESAIQQYAAGHAEGKLGKVAQPLRIAVTGSVVSPAIFDTLAILGRQSTLSRIELCIAKQQQEPQRHRDTERSHSV